MLQEWKALYVNKHRKVATAISGVVEFVGQWSQNESLEIGNHLKAICYLNSLKIGFKDVQFFLFTRKHTVLLNLIGLHYSIIWLEILVSDFANLKCTFLLFRSRLRQLFTFAVCTTLWCLFSDVFLIRSNSQIELVPLFLF